MREKQTRSSVSQLTKNMMIIDLMKQTGWTRDRAVAAIEELERIRLVHFPSQGGLRIRTNVEVN
ncbi:hypothetical protein [Streptococcus hyointestinalis]|uniref:hypothetical protein n=1 Tax=Streptococcus hyointestinalis TaxID=1337 RepID=UPI0013DFE7C7|nr:hypothetical protein [Streptococcus hyointestinalis]